MNIILRIFVVALALMLATYVVPGVAVSSIYSALGVAIVLGVLNIFVRPLLVLFTLPISILTFGLFVFCINAVLFWAAGGLVSGFEVSGFLPALVGSLFVSVVSAVAQKILS